jgi:hypothetical protein
MRHGLILTWRQGLFEFQLTQNYQSVSKGQLQAKHMLIVFWGIHGIPHYYWLPKDSTLDSSFFYGDVLRPLAQKMQPNSKKLANP